MKLTTEKSPTEHRTGTAILVIALLVFAAPLLALGIRYLRLDNNVESWLPANDSESAIFNWYRRHFNEEERIIVTWRGSTLEDPRFDKLRNRLLGQVDADGIRRGGVPYISSVVTGHDMLKRMVDYGVPQDEAISRMTGTLIGTGRVKLRLTDAGREARALVIQQLKEKAHNQLGIDVVVFETSSSSLAMAQTETESSEVESATMAISDESDEVYSLDPIVIPEFDLELTWKGYSPVAPQIPDLCTIAKTIVSTTSLEAPRGHSLVDDCFVIPCSPVALTVTLSEAGRADASSTLIALKDSAIQVGIPAEDLVLGGGSVATTELNKSVMRSVWNPTAPFWKVHRRSVMLLSGFVGMVLAFWSLRSVRLGLLVLGVSYYASFISTAIVPLTGGAMTMVLIVLPTFVMVVALSGAIHVANYVGYETHVNPNGAVDRGVKVAWLTCFNSVSTTVLGLLSLLSSSLVPVRDFGLYSSIGASLTLFMVLVVLPAMLKLFPTKGRREIVNDEHRWRSFSQFLVRWSSPIYWTSVVACLVACGGLCRFRTETRVIRNFADDSRLIHDYKYIEEQLTGISSVETILRFNQESQKSLRFLERMELVRQVADGLRCHNQVTGAVCLPDFQPVRTAPDAESSGRERIAYNRRSSETEKRVKDPATAGDASSLLAVAKDPADLHAPGDHGLNSVGDELWRITVQVPALADVDYIALTAEMDEIIQSVMARHTGTSHVVTGTVPLFMRTQEALLNSLIWSFVYAYITIGAVMVLALRSLSAGMLSMLPNVLPIGAVFGLISWGYVRTDIGTMITASVGLGLAVDNSLHLLAWFRKAIEEGHKRDEAIVSSLVQCGPALLQTNIGIALAMIVLYPSDLVMISRFGWLMSALTFAAYFGNVVILPVMLKGMTGRIIEARTLKTRAAALELQAAQQAEAETQVTSHPVVVEVATPESDAATVTPFDDPAIMATIAVEDASGTDETSMLESLPIEQARKAKRHAG